MPQSVPVKPLQPPVPINSLQPPVPVKPLQPSVPVKPLQQSVPVKPLPQSVPVNSLSTENNLQCKLCKYKANTLKELKSHYTRNHGTTITGEPKLTKGM